MALPGEKRDLLVSKGWVQAAAVVLVFGLFVLGLLAYSTYTGEPPIPLRTVDPTGHIIFTRADILGGQQVFLRNGLMEYGSVFGHGAYLGPDFTADYLHRAALFALQQYGGVGDDRSRAHVLTDFQMNRYDSATETLRFTSEQARAFEGLARYYHAFFADPTTRNGLRPAAIAGPAATRQLTAFFAWSAWAATAHRPGLDYSYTNNWPPEPLVGNHVTADAIVWSMLSLAALLGGVGLLMGAFGRWRFLGWHGREEQTLSFRNPGEVGLTPAQRSCAWFFLVMSILFLAQTLLGGASQHYRAELSNFFGIDLARWLPFNLARTWHLQLAIFWVATSYLATGIFQTQ
jgi:nitric oxide reductase subunit B